MDPPSPKTYSLRGLILLFCEIQVNEGVSYLMKVGKPKSYVWHVPYNYYWFCEHCRGIETIFSFFFPVIMHFQKVLWLPYKNRIDTLVSFRILTYCA